MEKIESDLPNCDHSGMPGKRADFGEPCVVGDRRVVWLDAHHGEDPRVGFGKLHRRVRRLDIVANLDHSCDAGSDCSLECRLTIAIKLRAMQVHMRVDELESAYHGSIVSWNEASAHPNSSSVKIPRACVEIGFSACGRDISILQVI
jgi:hypothetical protein